MEEIKRALAEYIVVLSKSAANTSHADERSTYTRHLAAAAVMLADLQLGGSVSQILEQVTQERRDYGWGFLSGDEGAAAENAFNRFASLVEQRAAST